MAKVSTAAAVVAPPEGVLHRRIDFHLARKLHTTAVVGGGGFRMETLNPDAATGAAAAAGASSEGEARRPEKGEAAGLDQELAVARIYLGRIGAGLQNLGNTCYLNSVLQCLTYTEPLAAYLQSGRHKSSCRTAGFCALCALQNHVKTALQSTGKIVTPSQIVKNLRCISRSFRNSRQEDAHELMVNLLESMHKCCLPSGVPSESPSAYEKSLVHRIFGGRLRSQVKCTRCSHCSNKFDPFLDLSLDIAKGTTVVRALQNFTEDELLDGGQKQYQCEHCRQKVVAKKRFTIDRAPNVLTIHLKRFSPFKPREKIDKKVDFPLVLDLKPFVSDSKGTDYKYSLYGVLVHAGYHTQSGHYYCFVRTSSGMWHNLDDNQVRQVREADVLKQKAYMLFYVRDIIENTTARKGNFTPNVPVKKVVPGKISCLNGVIQSGVMEEKKSAPSSPYTDKKSQSMSNGITGIIGRTSADHCAKNGSKTEAATASQNNGLSSAQETLAPLIDIATLSTKSKQNAVSSHKEASLSGQRASLIDASGNRPMTEISSQEPKADGAFTKLENSTSVAKSPARLSETDKQTSHSQSTIVSSSESLKQDDTTVKKLPMSKNSMVPGHDQNDVGKQVCSEVSTKVVAADSCNARMAKRKDLKPTKFVRYLVVNRQLSLGSVKLQKKRKHKRSKRQPLACKSMENVVCSSDNAKEQKASTSASVPPDPAECTPRKRKRAYGNGNSENDTQSFKNSQQVDGASAGDPDMENGNIKSANSASAELPKLGPSSSASRAHSTNSMSAKPEVAQRVGILTKDLAAEVTVPCWDDVSVPNLEIRESKKSESKSIGYVLDEWDEEYDRGKTKKVRKSKEDDYDGLNPFQEEANYVSQGKRKQKGHEARSNKRAG